MNWRKFFSIAFALFLLGENCLPKIRKNLEKVAQRESISIENKKESLEQIIRSEIKLEKTKVGKFYVVTYETPIKLSQEAKTILAYILSRELFDGFIKWLEKLEKGEIKEREKARRYKEVNPNLIFKEENFWSAIVPMIEMCEGRGWSFEVVLAVALHESLLNQIRGLKHEIGPFHALPYVAKEYARKLGKTLKDEEDLDPRVALEIFFYHMHLLLKNSKKV
ncbi:MAG: hypothetical protein NZ889_02910, partial [Candidatus Pacearchaeota archaeon]|nr:hypothetical protein [Candidatus Pacearchaeota archaeon]